MRETHFSFSSISWILLIIVNCVRFQASATSASVMQDLKKSLNIPTSFGWSDSDVCTWSHVKCSFGKQVSRIQIGQLGLTGSLPASLNKLAALESFEAFGNHLTGPLPSFSGLNSLVTLMLNDNNFSHMPADFFNGMSSLQSVYLENNPFSSWVFPESIKSATGLVTFSATSTNMIGTIPVFLGPGNFPSLRTLHLAFNYLEGSLPSSFSGSTISSLWLNGQKSSSRLNGSIAVIANMTLLTQVWLHSNSFSGPLPDFSGLTELTDLSLRDNQLTGPIPDSLLRLSSLRTLSLYHNYFQGPTPKFSTSVNVDILNSFCSDEAGVPCQLASKGKEKGKGVAGVVVGSVVGGLGVAIVSAGLVIFCIFWNKSNISSGVEAPSAMAEHDTGKITISGESANGMETSSMVISFQVLKNVTSNFSEEKILGKGGFGTVYKGELHDGTKIAVKRMECGVLTEKGLDEFKSEIEIVTKVRHRHLVALLGYCIDGNERILVYEYMPRGTLSKYLFHWQVEGLKPLEWTKRIIIALDVARGVEYLHGLAQQSFIHRDLKPSNILLGDDMRAKVADFGLIRRVPDGKSSVVTRVAGTFGYLAPEYAVLGRVTTKADVFSFGVILMELITGRKALDESQPEESVHLVPWFRRMQLNKETFQMAIDPSIDLTEETLVSLNTVAELAGHCCAREPQQRPDMNHVVNVLSSLSELWKPVETDPDDIYGIEYDRTLSQALKKWQGFEGMSGGGSSYLDSGDNSQTIPTRPFGFAD